MGATKLGLVSPYTNFLLTDIGKNLKLRFSYPNCLHILSLLKSPKFRKDIATTELSTMVYNDMVDRWKEPLKTATTPKNAQTAEATNNKGDESQLDQEKTNQSQDSVNTGADIDGVGKAANGAASASKQTSDGDTVMSTEA
ncbi:hypothetical protein B5S33_g5199 [[Candida] boidinii]|nr:hypothetical protein B5S27_g3270 [[Candida] boidinii]OWB66120.1 hypothetical protein B5S30_g1456 [[Candida] boidinii]OWB86500.1 hypothetical protein B5S33_g5199 [[Candida] boidinii]